MLVQRARSAYWKKWAAKHEYEELKEGAWLEPGLDLLRKKAMENWTDKQPGRYSWKVDGRQRLFDIGWSDVSQCQACQKEKGTEKHMTPPLSRVVRSQTGDSRGLHRVGAKGENVKEGVEVQRGIVVHPLSESQWNSGHFSMRKGGV